MLMLMLMLLLLLADGYGEELRRSRHLADDDGYGDATAGCIGSISTSSLIGHRDGDGYLSGAYLQGPRGIVGTYIRLV